MKSHLIYNGRHMWFGDGGGSEHITGGEGPIMSRHFDVKPGEWVVDVGAGDSSWTLYALASGAERVYAFEPSLPNFKKLVVDVLANDGEGFFERARLHNIGLGSTDTVMTLENWYDGAGGPGFEVSQDCLVKTRFLPLDFFQSEMPRFDWIKMDVEGGEWSVMLGARALLERCRPKMIIENHSQIVRIGEWMKENKIVESIYGFLKSHDYEVFEDSCDSTIGRTFIIAKPKEK